MTTPEEIKTEYASSLADLTFNSKPLINVLTMLAEENSPNARVIVEAIETHLSKVATDVKLPILYLIDCIVKNVGGTYTTLFSQNIVSTFCGVFKAVDERTRGEMFKLRQTWNEVFPQKKLYAIDVQINLLDPAWPVTAKPPSNSIHFNPKFLKTTAATKPKLDTSEPTQVNTSTTVPGNVDKETLLMQEKLIQKQKELLELQRKKLELEVLQTQVKLQEQINKAPTVSLPTRPQNILLKPEVAKQLVPAVGKNKPVGINTTSLLHQKHTNTGNGPRINPVSSALISAAKPIRDPRLIRQQPKTSITNSNIPVDQKTTVLESNKIVSNKMGIRKIRSDPRLINKDDNFPQKNDTMKSSNLSKSRNSDLQKLHKTSRATSKGSSDSNSTKSSSSSSLDSPTKSKSEKKSPLKNKKRDKSDDKKSFSKDEKRDKVLKSGSPTTIFKGVKSSTKNRNYIRRNLAAMSPEPQKDEDLRSLPPPEKQPRLQGEPLDVQSNNIVSTTKGMDTDLRQLPAIIGKKRTSVEADDQSSVKRSKIEVFDKLFGDEDTDLRQLPITTDRPPTPPPPIISSSDSNTENIESPTKSNLDAIRAKLANATNRDKIMAKSFNRKKMVVIEDQDLRVPKVSSTTDIPNKIIISPEDESSIKSGTLTKEQEKTLLKKIIMQMEKNKLKEAQKKDHEESFNISLQPISDDELVDSDEEKTVDKEPIEIIEIDDTVVTPTFHDKDERFRSSHPQSKPDFLHSSFHPRDARRLPPAPHGWRGGPRGGRRHWDNHPGGFPRMPVRPWAHPNSWRNMPSNFPPKREFIADEDEVAKSPDISEDQLTNGAVNQDEIKTIIIDGLPKDIRFYDETPIVFINWDDPREITFQDGTRRVVFNDTDSCHLNFNKPYQEVLINGSPHLVRLGGPSREVYIDHVPYECYFGSAGIRIVLNGVPTTVKLEGPPPQVKIGEKKRTDLVAGKINLFINAQIVVPVFLDAKVQKFIIDGETSTLKFVNALETVLINDVPFSVEYGGLPKPIFIHGTKHFIRFSVLPKGIKPGQVVIRDMEGQGSASLRIDENSQDSMSVVDPNEPALPMVRTKQLKGTDSPERNSNSPNFLQNLLQQQSLSNLDVLSNVMTPSLGPVSTGGYEVENIPHEGTQSTSLPQVAAPLLPPTLNINDLFQKLVASGFVTSGNEKKLPLASPSVNIQKQNNSHTVTKEAIKPFGDSSSSSSQIPVKPLKKNLYDNLRLITFTKPEMLKVRQGNLYSLLYSGMQCSSCGMRFSPEASMQYSQHLDWHFRQNRKGKRNTRVAASRKWYYSLSDWKNYEEVEDLEEREKNYFDQQQQAENGSEEPEEEIEIPSVPADPESTNECCDVCHEKFDQFFNEEKEEWHLRNAIRMDDKTYHPICYDDYQQSLLEKPLDDSKLDESKDERTEDLAIPGLEIVIEDDEDESQQNLEETPEVVSLESDESKPQQEEANEESQDAAEEDDDDVILNEVAPIKIVVDDDDDEMKDESHTDEPITVKEEKLDDGFVEVAGLVSLQNGGQIKIKAEPIDPDDLATIEGTMNLERSISVAEAREKQLDKQIEDEPSSEIAQTHSEVITSIDGNIEIVCSTPSAVPTSGGISGNKIKINISKPLPVILTKEKDNKSENEFPTATYIDPSEPFPPGEEPEPVSLKPALQGVKLKKLPPVRRGTELSGLCSIM